MDAQKIGVATAVVSAAIAALGLLLTWYRHEEGKEERKGFWLFVAAGVGVVSLTAVGVTLIFMLGADIENSPGSTDMPVTPTQLTEAQYVGQLGTICSDAREDARRLDELQARETLFGPEIDIEQDVVDQIRQLRPPGHLNGIHEDIVAVWQRRIGLLESTYQRLSTLSDYELETEAAASERLAEQLEEPFQELGAIECLLTN